MSQAANLLNDMPEEPINYGSESHIVVGKDRFIIVPPELKRIAVQGDHNVETVVFDCLRYWDNHDLSTMRLYISYLRADGSAGSFLAENIVVDETDDEMIHFTWTITHHTSEIKGALRFLICAKKVDNDGNEVNHWNSEINDDMYVSEGLECEDMIVEAYPDIIEYILTRLNQLTNNLHTLTSPGGKTFKLVVDENGTLSTEAL
jgi:hypothetical protein